ncbi:MAG: hypothetical protein KGJ23_09975 [Euryarchaeota archaeon]|nr:hypothetical protein [Euryarchaeota archaeon]MDE1836931.1 hypothetical protein [Euryarchaeota archaeon]MDE1882227.1 hypothetical protein [Euryarchaeota archaeon]MDE2045083.1 hypothetical protein [Thermoplasmata archaeon]
MASKASASQTHEPPEDRHPAKGRPLSEVGMTPSEAKALRARLASFAREWDDPRMDVYNDAAP